MSAKKKVVDKEKKKEDCESCGGDGEQECSCCCGSGMEECIDCNGTGQIEVEEE